MKWITSLDLERWADTIGSRATLSELVRDLIRASVSDIGAIRFPTGDTSQMPGWDGHLVSSGAQPYVPVGESGWEFGTDKGVVAKANADYKTRSENAGVITKDSATFVFVTPRKWTDGELWAQARSAEGVWKRVQILDVVALEDWLGLCPGVAARFAREILPVMPNFGVRSTDQFWEEYCTRFKPDLTTEVLLADRQHQADMILNQMRTTSSVHMWQADSTEEVVAFSVAAIRKAEPEVRRFIEMRTLIIDTGDAARQLEPKSEMVLLLRADSIPLAGMLAQRNLVIVPVGRDNPTQSNATLLEQQTIEGLTTAIKSMGLSEPDARRLASNCGRSVTIMARQISSALAEQPKWAGHSQLIPAVMAGSWTILSEQDRNAVAALAGTRNYAEYEQQLLPYLRMQDSPLIKEGDVWQVRAPVDAFAYLGHLVGVGEFERLGRVATTVFSETDPSLDLPDEERLYAGIYGKNLKHSSWLRDGLAKTLRLIAILSEPLGLTNTGLRPDHFVEKLLSELPGLALDYRRIASLHGELPILMEAAPRPLLAALGRMLEGDGRAIAPIFQDKDPFLSRSPHTGLLWALEALAWDPRYLSDAALTLAGLARVDPGGKLMNRPLGSLREIFLAWHPSTNATLAQRLATLDQIIAKEPRVGWELLLKLLPGYHDVANPNAKPRYRDGGVADRELLTYGLVAKSYREIVGRAINLPGTDPQRWVALVKNVSTFESAQRLQTMQLLQSVVEQFSTEQRYVIWSSLRDLVAHHKAFPNADWAMKEADMEPLETLVHRLTPSDSVAQVAWLFNEYNPRIPREETPQFDLVERTREQAIHDLLREVGTAGVLKLADTVAHPEFAAVAIGAVVNTIQDFASLTELSVNKTANLATFASVLSSQAEQKLGDVWRSQIKLWKSQQTWSNDRFVELILNWRDERQTWEFATALGPECERSYWERKRSWPLQRLQSGDYEMAARSYLKVGRAIAAVQSSQYAAGAMSTDVLFEMLDAAVVELNAMDVRATSDFVYNLDQIFDALRERRDIPLIEIAKREYAYLPLFGYREKQLAIHQVMGSDPQFYVGLLCDAFKPKSGDDREVTPALQARAKAAYRLVSEFRTVPGVLEGEINEEKLLTWVQEVHRLVKEADRAAIGDEFIGHVLAYTPADPDGAWPHRIVRQLIENMDSKEMELGIQIERFNMRGVQARALYGGGGPEREMAERAKHWANVTRAWPRTSAMLEAIAASWESTARNQDERARQDRMRYES